MSGPNRPRRLVFVTGTATEVGKTWVGGELLARARARGLAVAARKPAQSFEMGSTEPTDAARLAAATGEPADRVCPRERSYALAMAPPMAAAVLGRPVPDISSLVEEIEGSWGPAGSPGRPGDPVAGGVDLGLVEGAGGVASPLGADGDSATLARALGVDVVVLVADPGLGVINSVRLSVAALRPLPVVVRLNRFDPGDDLQRRNADWLRDRDGLGVTTSIGELLGRLA